jgi:hypothetical protein
MMNIDVEFEQTEPAKYRRRDKYQVRVGLGLDKRLCGRYSPSRVYQKE